jgi:hypothetical protein
MTAIGVVLPDHAGVIGKPDSTFAAYEEVVQVKHSDTGTLEADQGNP